MTTRILVLLLIIMTAGGCAKIKTMNALNDFEMSAKKYNLMLRWHELDMAGTTFADESVKEEYSQRARAAKGVMITDYRVAYQECNPEKKFAKVVVDIDYYTPPSVTLKSVTDVQKWEYVNINDKQMWRLKSLPPEFK